MTSRGTDEFWQLYHGLPPGIRHAARNAFQKLSANPAHPGLQLERLRFDTPRMVSADHSKLSSHRQALWRRLALVLGLARTKSLTGVSPK